MKNSSKLGKEIAKEIRFDKEMGILLRRKNYARLEKKLKSHLRKTERNGSWREVYHTFSRLVNVYLLWGEKRKARDMLRQCTRRFQYISTTAIYGLAEQYFWGLGDCRKTIELAEQAMSLNTYYKAMYLKGLASFELGDMKTAIETLRDTKYYDLMLVEKLIGRKIGLKKCKVFLKKALIKYNEYKANGEEVEATINKIKELQRKISNLASS